MPGATPGTRPEEFMARPKLEVQNLVDLTCHNIFLLRLLNSVELPEALKPELERGRFLAQQTIDSLIKKHARLCDGKPQSIKLFTKLAAQIEERFQS